MQADGTVYDDNDILSVYYRGPLRGRNQSLRQMGSYQQKQRTFFQKWIAGSAWAASLLTFFVFLVIAAVQCVIYDLVLEEQFPDLFPIDAFLLGTLGAVIAFSGGLYVQTERQLLQDMIYSFSDIAGNCVTLAWEVTAFVSARQLQKTITGYKYTSLYTVSDSKVKVWEVMRDLNEIIRVIPWAIDLDNTPNPQDKPPRDETSYPGYLTRGTIKQLPLQEHLKFELEAYSKANESPAVGQTIPSSSVSDQLWHMCYLRLHILLRDDTNESPREFFGPNLFAVIDRQCSGLSTQSAQLQANRAASVTPIVKGFLYFSTVLWSLLVPLVMWGSYRYFTLPLLIVVLWPLWALYFTGAKLENQFRDYNDSNFVVNDLNEIAVDAARQVDRVFDTYWRIGGVPDEKRDFFGEPRVSYL